MTFKPVLIEKLDELLQAYASGRCDFYTTDASGLAAVRAGQLAGKGEHTILPERISKEPLGPLVRHGDSFECNVGARTPLKIERGQNALWSNGGLMYAIPFR
jgi:hypothetical protein